MATQTLLTMVQNILSEMSSDEVNSISDTTESLQVANIVQTKFYDIIARGTFPLDNQLFQLNPSNDSTKPTLMLVPAGIGQIQWIKYFDASTQDDQQVDQFGSYHDTNTDIIPGNSGSGTSAVAGYKYVTMLPIDQFIDFTSRFNPTDSDVQSFEFSEGGPSFTFYYKNDHQPSYCTVLSNTYVLFDSYNNVFDTTLQASNTMCFGQVLPVFELVDTFTPQLNDNQFSLLLNEAKALAFYNLKQMPHALADREIQRQWAVAQKTKSISNRPSYFDELSNFGRVPRTGGYSSGGYGAYKWMRGGGGAP